MNYKKSDPIEMPADLPQLSEREERLLEALADGLDNGGQAASGPTGCGSRIVRWRGGERREPSPFALDSAGAPPSTASASFYR